MIHCQLPHELRIPIAVRTAELMIEMTNVRSPAKFDKNIQQSNGIRPARHTDEQRFPGREGFSQSGLHFGEHGSLRGPYFPQPAHVRYQRLGDFHAAIGLLVSLQQRDV